MLGLCKKFQIALICIIAQFFSFLSPALAANRTNFFEREKLNLSQLSEFIYGDEVNDKLGPVYLLGAVRQPGLYHLPAKTNLTTLLSIAGGPTETSDLEEIVIRNEESKRMEKINYHELVSSVEMKSPILYPRDVILVAAKEPAISNNTVLTVTVIASVVGIIVSGLLIKKSL